MNSRAVRAVYWVVALFFHLASMFCLNLATYDWFAADSHTIYSRAYASRGNAFFAASLGLLAGLVAIVVALFRSRRKRQKNFTAPSR